MGKGGSMDPATLGALLAAIVSGVASQLGTQLWDGVVSLVRRPFRRETAASEDAASVVPSGEAELAALQQTPDDQQKALTLAEVLLGRSDTDGEFRLALQDWWEQAEPIRASINARNVANTISGGAQHGPVLQGGDFTNVTFGAGPATPKVPPR
jgi:hypothetical protein